jgi:hypothetical protein
MAKEQARLVRKSNLYEYKGISKSLLERIALLIIGPDKEGEEPDPDAGWCVARQEVLASMHGCSREEVSRQILRFESDGWLTIDKKFDKNGHPKYRYTFTPKQLKAIEGRKMEFTTDEHGRTHYIRASNPKMKRKGTSLNNIVQVPSGKRIHSKKLEEPCDNQSRSHVTRSQPHTLSLHSFFQGKIVRVVFRKIQIQRLLILPTKKERTNKTNTNTKSRRAKSTLRTRNPSQRVPPPPALRLPTLTKPCGPNLPPSAALIRFSLRLTR